MFRVRWVWALVFLCTLSSATTQAGVLDFLWGDDSQQRRTLSIGTNVWPGYEPLYLAKAKGLLSAEKLNLVEYPSATQVIKGFRNGDIEFAALTLDEALILAENGLNPKVILIMDISDGGDVVLAAPHLLSMQALKGKRIAVESSALGAYVLTRALQVNQMQLADITTVPMEVDEMVRAYEEQRIEAAVTFEPFRHILLEKGARQVFDSTQIPGEVVDVLITTEEIVNKYPDVIQHLVSAWFAALEALENKPQDAAAIIAQRLKISPKEVIASYDGLKLPTRGENQALMQGTPSPMVTTANRLKTTMLQSKLLTKDIHTPKLFENSFVKVTP